jgi:uncharacterized protein YgbK (DUF1537 family)
MIGVVADDLTGAAELGAIGLRHGLTAQVIVEGEVTGSADLVCIDTDSRSCAPEEAGRRTATAVEELRQAGATWFYKKADSVLRGNVVAEMQAAMGQLGLTQNLLVPANPGLGRVIRNGCYFINGNPLDQTSFRLDPEHPRLTSNVLDLLGRSDSMAVGLGVRSAPLAATGLTLGEAESVEDLRAWAERCDASILAGGGAEFFAALLALREPPRSTERGSGEAQPQHARTASGLDTSTPSTSVSAAAGLRQSRAPLSRADEKRPSSTQSPTISPNRLFVCGSTSSACQNFINEMRAEGVPVFAIPVTRSASPKPLATEICQALESSPRVLLTIEAGQGSTPAIGQSLLDQLATTAAAAMSRGAVRQIFAEGGATAARLLRHLGWKRLDVLRELAPGVVTLAAAGRTDCLLTIKPGSYMWPKAVRKAFAYGT